MFTNKFLTNVNKFLKYESEFDINSLDPSNNIYNMSTKDLTINQLKHMVIQFNDKLCWPTEFSTSKLTRENAELFLLEHTNCQATEGVCLLKSLVKAQRYGVTNKSSKSSTPNDQLKQIKEKAHLNLSKKNLPDQEVIERLEREENADENNMLNPNEQPGKINKEPLIYLQQFVQ